MNFVFAAQISQPIKGIIKSDITIYRTVGGIKLKIGCFLVDGNYVGSCVYNDFCQVIKWRFNVSADNCPEFLLDNSIDCACPFSIPAGLMDIKTYFDLPDFSTTTFPWLRSGDFDVDLKLTQGNNSILCMNIKFSMKPK